MSLKIYQLDLFIFGAKQQITVESDAPTTLDLQNYLEAQNENYNKLKESIDVLNKLEDPIHTAAIKALESRAADMKINNLHISLIFKRLSAINELQNKCTKILIGNSL